MPSLGSRLRRALTSPGDGYELRALGLELAHSSGDDGELGIDALLRLAALKLLAAGDAADDAAVAAAARDAAGTLPRAPATASLAYLRDRVGVPRDAAHPEASELRAALAWLHDVVLEQDAAPGS